MSRVAIFDLDGTLTRQDTFLLYGLGYVSRHPWRLPRLVTFVPMLALFVLGRIGRDKLKTSFIAATIAGAGRSELAIWTKRFVRSVLDHQLRPGAIHAIDEHRQKGDRLVLATASLDLYANDIAEALGFDECIATRVAWDDAGRVRAALDGPNLKGPAKLTAVETRIGRDGLREASAYSDEASDLPLLTAAARGVLVKPQMPVASRAGVGSTIAIENWS